MNKILLAAVAVSMMSVGSASAQSLLDGAYAGIAGGYGVGTSELSDATGNVPGVVELGSNGWDGSLFAGFGSDFDGIYVGLEGSVGYSGLESETTLGGLNIKGKAKQNAAITARLGSYLTPGALVYGQAGLAYAVWDLTDGTTVEKGVTSYKLGLGIEQDLANNTFVRFGTEWDIGRDPVRVNDADIKIMNQTAKIGVGLRF